MATTINGGTGIDKVQDAVVTDGKLNLSPNSQPIKDALNAGGLAPIYACRAWLNYDGVNNVIRASGNVVGVTDNGVGDYTSNFAVSLEDDNGVLLGQANPNPALSQDRNRLVSGAISSSAYRVVVTEANTGAMFDVPLLTIAVVR